MLIVWIFAVAAGNFDIEYISINPHGTIPSLIAPELKSPLVDSRDILRYIDNMRPSALQLQPKDAATGAMAEKIIELVHSDRMSTNLILLQARDPEEMRAKQSGLWKTFVQNRQHQLQHWRQECPDQDFYHRKLDENTPIYQLYASDDVEDPAHKSFYAQTHAQYRDFANGLNELSELVKLPYVVGGSLTSADLHVVPWLSHAMWGAGGSEVDEFGPLEKLIQKSVADFEIGNNIKNWWTTMAKRASFRDVFPELH